jgi:hypothetical protein
MAPVAYRALHAAARRCDAPWHRTRRRPAVRQIQAEVAASQAARNAPAAQLAERHETTRGIEAALDVWPRRTPR